MVLELARPRLTFDMFQAGTRGGARLAYEAQRDFFGHENFDYFRQVAKRGVDIPEEDRQRVDCEIYEKVWQLVGIPNRSGEGLWYQSISLSDKTFNEARTILFPEGNIRATMVTDLTKHWNNPRPSQILERLTESGTEVSEQLRFEQGRQLGLALLCAEIISNDQNGEASRILQRVQQVMYGQIIIGRKGETEAYPRFSYHEPDTNKVVGVSKHYPDPNYDENLWVKDLDLSVRKIALTDEGGELEKTVPAIYDPREKEVESAVIKAMRRSLGQEGAIDNPIETLPHLSDMFGFRLVVAQGGHIQRDRVTDGLERFFRRLDDVYHVRPDNYVDPSSGSPERVKFRRMQVSINGLATPIEVIIQSLVDYINQEYHVGSYDPTANMHDGSAHILYKLNRVASVAPFIWPENLYAIDLKAAKIKASLEYATRLGRVDRIHPTPYPELGF